MSARVRANRADMVEEALLGLSESPLMPSGSKSHRIRFGGLMHYPYRKSGLFSLANQVNNDSASASAVFYRCIRIKT